MPLVPPLDALPAVPVERVELVVVELPVLAPLVAAHGAAASSRPVLLLRVVADGVDGWAECAVESTPAYDGFHTEGELAALRDEVIPIALRSGLSDWSHLDAANWRRPGVAALELAVLDAQLQVAGRSLADWLGATETVVAAGATVGLAPDPAD
ncbi:MAG: hypothetical protein M3Z03_17190, partial [Actinomycetota bacterium]|nr:hypothetical protein [Actinomycetota bacterium]